MTFDGPAVTVCASGRAAARLARLWFGPAQLDDGDRGMFTAAAPPRPVDVGSHSTRVSTTVRCSISNQVAPRIDTNSEASGLPWTSSVRGTVGLTISVVPDHSGDRTPKGASRSCRLVKRDATWICSTPSGRIHHQASVASSNCCRRTPREEAHTSCLDVTCACGYGATASTTGWFSGERRGASPRGVTDGLLSFVQPT